MATHLDGEQTQRASRNWAGGFIAIVCGAIFGMAWLEQHTPWSDPWSTSAEPNGQAPADGDTLFGDRLRTASYAQQRETLFLAKRMRISGTNLENNPGISHRDQVRRHIAAMPAHSTALSQTADRFSKGVDDQWESLGPGNAGGRTRTLLIHPENPQIMYAGGVSGGLWKSTDGGDSWTPISDLAANLNIGALAMHPQNPDILYMGTGELYRRTARSFAGMAGMGILKSIDGGSSWIRLASTASSDFRYVSDIVISHNDSDVVYAASDQGIWRSRDGGGRFELLLSPTNDQGQLLYEGCTDLALRTDLPTDHLLASCSSRSLDDRYYLPGLLPQACDGPCNARLYLTTDANAEDPNWQVVLTEPGMGRTQVSIHQSDQNIMYALSASIAPGRDISGDGKGDYDNALHGVFRSDDAGFTWEATVRNTDPDLLNTQLLSYPFGPFLEACGYPPTNRQYYGAGWYDQALAVDPIDPDTVWVGGILLFRSSDGGRNWGFLSPDTASTRYGGDLHIIRFHPDYDGNANQTMYLGNDGGLYQTDNAGASVPDPGPERGDFCTLPTPDVEWRALNNSYGVTQFYAGAAFPDGKSYMGGAQDVGNWIGTDDDGANAWRKLFSADGGYMAVDPRDHDVIYATSIGPTIGRSEDRGQTWVYAANGINDLPIVTMPFVMDPVDPDRLWAAGTRLWRTRDRGDSWSPVSAPLSTEPVPEGVSFPISSGSASAIAVSPHDPNFVLIGNREGIYRHRHALLSGNQVVLEAMQAPRDGWVSSLTFDPIDPMVAYATYSTYGGAHVWKSEDRGLTWSNIDGQGPSRLPDFPVHKLIVDPGNNQRLYLGTEMGVFVTLDGGAHWALENTGFANVIVEHLAVSQGEGTPYLFAFTFGRGAWRVALDQLDAVNGYEPRRSFSGSWYAPELDGQGLVLEQIEQDGQSLLVVFWFTYLEGRQVWMTGTAPLQGAFASVRMQVATGGQFPPEFQSSPGLLEDWGNLQLDFNDEDSLVITWTANDPRYGTAASRMQRITTISEPDNETVAACQSGAWYDPEQAGQGLLLEVIDVGGQPQMLGYWFVYDNNQPLWLIGSGPLDHTGATLTMTVTAGTDFPPRFSASDVNRETWGELRVEFDGKDTGQASWQPVLNGFAAGSMPLTRLTYLAGVDCG